MAARRDDLSFDLLFWPQQLDLDLRSGFYAFREPWHRQQAVGPHQRRDDARAALYWSRNHSLPDPPQGYADVLVLSHGRHDLAGHRGLDSPPSLRLHAELQLDQRLYEQLAGEHGGHRVAGDAEHGLAPHDPEDDRVARSVCDPVNDELSHLLHETGRVVL